MEIVNEKDKAKSSVEDEGKEAFNGSKQAPGKGEEVQKDVTRVLLFSGGRGSWAAGKRIAARHGTEKLILLFTDTKSEDEDLYRFLIEAAANVMGQEGPAIKRLARSALALPPVKKQLLRRRGRLLRRLQSRANRYLLGLEWMADGRDIWEVFNDRKLMGNTRADPCSLVLKREMSANYIKELDPAKAIVYVGIDWSEAHRYESLKKRWAKMGYRVEAPLCEPPYLLSQDIDRWMEAEGLKRPRLYDMGFEHNNCGGFCVKAGHSHFANLYRKMPERYAYHEQKEREFREKRGKDVSILRDFRGGKVKPMTLEAFRKRVESGEYGDGQMALDGATGCGCFAG